MPETPARFPDETIRKLKTLAPRWVSFGYFARIRAISEIYNECISQGGAPDVFFSKLKEILDQEDITDIRTAVEIYVKDGIEGFVEGGVESKTASAGAQVLATRKTIAKVGHMTKTPASGRKESAIVTIPQTTFKKLRGLAKKWDSLGNILDRLKIIAPIYDAFIENSRSKDEFVDIAAEILQRSQDAINLILELYLRYGEGAFNPALYGEQPVQDGGTAQPISPKGRRRGKVQKEKSDS